VVACSGQRQPHLEPGREVGGCGLQYVQPDAAGQAGELVPVGEGRGRGGVALPNDRHVGNRPARRYCPHQLENPRLKTNKIGLIDLRDNLQRQ
jgi:hypothetical protein